jgi:hypothetical protein
MGGGGGGGGYYRYYFTEFNTLRRNNGEMVPDFTNRFCKLYHQIIEIIKPLEPTTMVAYVASFEVDFSLHLIKINLVDLDGYLMKLK